MSVDCIDRQIEVSRIGLRDHIHVISSCLNVVDMVNGDLGNLKKLFEPGIPYRRNQ